MYCEQEQQQQQQKIYKEKLKEKSNKQCQLNYQTHTDNCSSSSSSIHNKIQLKKGGFTELLFNKGHTQIIILKQLLHAAWQASQLHMNRFENILSPVKQNPSTEVY